MPQVINDVSPNVFSMFWSEEPQTILTVNFNSLIDHFKLSGEYCLLHWQAKPKGLRRWGVFHHKKDGTSNYYGVNWDRLNLQGNPTVLQIDETKYNTLPTAVLFYNGCEATLNGESLTIQ